MLLAKDTVSRLEERGIELLPGNRAVRALEILAQSHDGRIPVRPDNPDGLATIAAAIRDIWEFQLIARALPRDRDADLDGKLRVMLRTSGRSEKPRDYQFELLVGAMFAMADIPVIPEPPDLRFLFQDREWGLAVKRVRSGQQLGPRTTRAREQLEEHGLRGLIAVNVDAFLEGVPASGDPALIGAAFDQGLDRLHRLLPALAEQPCLVGIAMIGAVAAWDFAGDKPGIAHPMIFQARGFGHDSSMTDELFLKLQQGIEGRVGEIYRTASAAMPK